MGEKRLKKSYLVLVALLSVAVLAGCGLAKRAVEGVADKAAGAIAEKVVEETMGISVDEKEGTVTIKGVGEDAQDLTISGGSGKVVEGFPLPIYPGTEVKDTGKLSTGEYATYTGEFIIKADFDDLVEFYENAMKERGVAEVTRLEASDGGWKEMMLMGQSETESGTIDIQWEESTGAAMVTILWGDK